MHTLVAEARALAGDELEIWIQYEDQKDNEWKSVFNHALGFKIVTDAYGHLLNSPRSDEKSGVFVAACGVGFHSQAYPSNSIDLGMSFTAMHWLSYSPGSLCGRSQMHAAQLDDRSPPPAEREQAAQDWLAILQARAKELRPGGRMVIVTFCKSKEGYFLGQTGKDVYSMWDSFQSSWDRLAEDGLIDEVERLGLSFPNYYRTTQECVEVVGQVPELEVVQVFEHVVPCPYRQAWVEGRSARSPREHAEWYVPTTRTWSEATFKSALKPSRDKDSIMEKFWSNYVDLVEQDPSKHGMDYVHCYILLAKKDLNFISL